MANDNKTKVDKIHRQINKIAMKGKGYSLEYEELVDAIIIKGQYVYLELCLMIKYGFDAGRYSNVADMKAKSWEAITLKTNSSLSEMLSRYYRSKKVFQQGKSIHSDDSNYAGLTWSGPMDSQYSSVATASHVSFSKDSSYMVGMNVLDGLVYRVDISSVKWSQTAPTDARLLQRIDSGTYSSLPSQYYVTQAPLTHGDYLFTVYKRKKDSYAGSFPNEFAVYNYRVGVTNGVFIGTIEEVDSVPDMKNYYYFDRKFIELTKMKKTFLEVTNSAGATITVVYDNPNKSEEMNLYQRYVLAIEYLLA